MEGYKIKACKDRDDYYKSENLIVILPSCYGNFNEMSAICQDCSIKVKCKEKPAPKDVEWCCNPP
ncbi:MAG: hypothetical protein ACFE9S_10385 [Candidatus Hermodarchaeota archaeon]